MTIQVLDPGPRTLVQDLGRPGHAHLGVPRSGALDLDALALANRLVGNDDGAAGLEVLLGGLRLRLDRSATVALTGGLRLVVGGSARAWGEAVGVPAGAEVRVEPAAGDVRGWLAVSGGLDVPHVLGSASTDTLSGLGPSSLAASDVVALAEPTGARPVGAAVPRRRSAVTELPLHVGLRDDWFTRDAMQTLLGSTYEVGADSDRVGVRFAGPALERTPETQGVELASEGIVTGAVQVPASGRPLVFLADHPTTGGYPVVGVVDPQALGRCAQLAPGDRVRFVRAR